MLPPESFQPGITAPDATPKLGKLLYQTCAVFRSSQLYDILVWGHQANSALMASGSSLGEEVANTYLSQIVTDTDYFKWTKAEH